MDDSRPGTHAILACVFAALIGVGAFVSIPLPFTPVPIGLQTLFVLLTGLVLGPLWGASAVALYLLIGILGLPVFAAGTGGLAHIAGPTGGYLVGFLPAAVVTGLIAGGIGSRWANGRRSRGTAGRANGTGVSGSARGRIAWDVVAVAAGTVVIYACGVPWLKMVADMPWIAALTSGLVPFMPGEAVKAAAAVALAPAARLAIRRVDTRLA